MPVSCERTRERGPLGLVSPFACLLVTLPKWGPYSRGKVHPNNRLKPCVRRDFLCILYLPRINIYLLNIPLEVVLAVIYTEFALRYFSSFKLYTFHFNVDFFEG